jgi:hypothetical protein
MDVEGRSSLGRYLDGIGAIIAQKTKLYRAIDLEPPSCTNLVSSS